jgi:peroxiredoxin
LSELGGLGEVDGELRARGGTLVAISVDPPERSRELRTRRGFTFPILSDQSRAEIRALGIVHKGGGPGNSEIAVPAQFLLDRDGRVLWSHVSQRIQGRADPADVLERVRALLGPSRG